NALTCSGCCQNGVCRAGVSPFVCGRSGQACFSCAPGFACPQGFCQLGFDGGLPPDAGSCGPTTCFGCCLNGICTSGLAVPACGTGGRVCSQCPPGFVCPTGFCQFIGSDGGVDAGSQDSGAVDGG